MTEIITQIHVNQDIDAIEAFNEVLENTLSAEREVYVEKLTYEVTCLNEKIVSLTANQDAVEKKRKYKAMLKQA